MELNGALSNPLQTHKDLLKRLSAMSRVERMTLKQRERRLVPARAGEVKAAVLGVVQQADVPLRLREIHARCEEAVGRRISYETVKDCVHKQARKSDSRLARVGHGVYWHP